MKKASALLLLLLLLFVPSKAQAHQVPVSVSSAEDFLTAAQNGGTITLAKDITLPHDTMGKDYPLILPHGLSIEGGCHTLSIPYGGVILGADSVFSNLQLYFQNPVRNAIILNGHALRLENFNTSAQLPKLSLFCGTVSAYQYTGTAYALPPSGLHGQLTIANTGGKTTYLHDICAGSLSDTRGKLANDPNDKAPIEANDWSCPSTITVEQGAKLSETVKFYACGARENRDGTANSGGPELYIEPEHFKVSGAVCFHLCGAGSFVDGRTGGSQNATLHYEDSVGYSRSMALVELDSLRLDSGHLLLKPADSFDPRPALGSSASLSLTSGTTLNLRGLGEQTQFQSWSGGSGDRPPKLILGIGQELRLSGSVTGLTTVELQDEKENILSPAPKIYVSAPKGSSESCFALSPALTGPQSFIYQDGENATWSGAAPEPPKPKDVKIKSISGPEEMVVVYEMADANTKNGMAIIPLNIRYDGASDPSLGIADIDPKNIYFEDQTSSKDGIFQVTLGYYPHQLSFGYEEIGPGIYSDVLFVERQQGLVPDNYSLQMILKAPCMASGQAQTLSLSFQVKKGLPPTPSQEPFRLSDLSFTPGSSQCQLSLYQRKPEAGCRLLLAGFSSQGQQLSLSVQEALPQIAGEQRISLSCDPRAAYVKAFLLSSAGAPLCASLRSP